MALFNDVKVQLAPAITMYCFTDVMEDIVMF